MTKIFERIYISAGLLVVTALSGCATGPEFGGAFQLVPNPEITVVRATAHQKHDGILVGGDVRRTNGYAAPVPGHLELVGRDKSGKIAATTNAPWGEFMNRRFRLAYFKAFLRTDDPSAIATIRIEAVAP